MKQQKGILDQLRNLRDFLNGNSRIAGPPSPAEVELREELKRDLTPILSPPDYQRERSWITSVYKPLKKEWEMMYLESAKARFSTRKDGLESLLDKLARLDLESWYTVADSSLPKSKRREKPHIPVATLEPVEARETELRFLDGQTLTIKKLVNASSDRERYFGILLEAIYTGDFIRLRFCGECEKFFVAEHLSMTYCGRKCYMGHDREPGKVRAKESRGRQALKLSEAEALTLLPGANRLARRGKNLQKKKIENLRHGHSCALKRRCLYLLHTH